ncbi:MAG: helix-turn-helix domain-containing protein [Bifidobacterium psychraerophilum]|uniref:winged helix-turn-helix transcriptional regulator n=1 Tax=Bifidobacterium psychraerophilum TaxID=218140 RepID=UPI0039E8EF78
MICGSTSKKHEEEQDDKTAKSTVSTLSVAEPAPVLSPIPDEVDAAVTVEADGGPDDLSMRYNVFSNRCVSRRLLTDVSRRWSILILSALRAGPQRFGELNETIQGMSERMLSITLKTLLKDQLVIRVGTSACSTYELTAPGRLIAAKADELFQALYGALEYMDPEQVLAAESEKV